MVSTDTSGFGRDHRRRDWAVDPDFYSWGEVMIHTPPYRVPLLGINLWACHGLPALFTGFLLLIFSIAAWEGSQHLVSPVTVTGLWAEPRQMTVAQVLAQTKGNGALHLSKNGYWTKACPTTAYQSYIDEQGVLTVSATPHNVEVPKEMGPFESKPRSRGVFVPAELALKVQATRKAATYRFRIENKSRCPWTIFPINNDPVEATFEIVP